MLPEDGGNMGLRNIGIQPQPYIALQSRRPRLEIFRLHPKYDSLSSFQVLSFVFSVSDVFKLLLFNF